MSMHFAPVPPSSGLERAEVRRAVRGLQSAVVRAEEVGSSRMFRLVVIAALNALDLLTTFCVLALGGSESNPLLAPHVDQFYKPVLIKIVVIGLLWVAVLRAPLHSRVAAIGLVVVATFYAVVVIWNTALLIGY